MHKTITSNDLLLYVYDEAPNNLAKEIEDHMRWDDDMRAELLTLLKAKDGLSLIRKKPSKLAIDSIKAFGKAFKVIKTKDRQFEMMAN